MPIPIHDVAVFALRKPTSLLFGAGACIPSGAPSSRDLAAQLAGRIDSRIKHETRSLSEVAEILAIKYGRRVVVNAVIEVLKDLTPSGGLLSIPLFEWRAIYSTNYDQMLERAFENANKVLPVIRSDLDFDKLDNALLSPPYFKLHGCITQDQSIGHRASLVLTETDYHRPTNYRVQAFNRLQTDIAASGVIVVGHSLRDKHLSDIIRDLAELQRASGYKHRINVVVFEEDDDYASIFEELGVAVSYGGINEFVAALEQAQEQVPCGTPTTFLGNVEFSRQVLSFARYVIPGDVTGATPERIYNGRPADYPDIESGLTFRRDVEDDVLKRIESGRSVTSIIGVGGTGKTTVARRILLECARRDIFCFEHLPHQAPSLSIWRDANQKLAAASRTGVLLVDDVTRFQREANELARVLSSADPIGLKLLVTAETSQWNPRQKDKVFLENGGPLIISELSEAELQGMLTLATSQKYLTSLVARSFSRVRPDNMLAVLRARTEQNMFLALRLLFENESIDNILLSEFSRLTENAQLLYRVVFGLQAVGVVVHRQLALRMLGLDASLIRALLLELDELVFEKETVGGTGSFVWETRHLRIAQILSEYVYANPAQRSALIGDAVESLNPSEPLERQFIADLCNSDFGIRSLDEPMERIALFQRIIEKDPKSRIARHRLVREFLRAGDIDGAKVQIREAESVVGLDPPIQRYKVLLALQQVRTGNQLDDNAVGALLDRAKSLADDGIRRFPDSKYQYLVFADVAREAYARGKTRDWLSQAETHLRNGYRRLLEVELESAANRIHSEL